MPKPGGQLGNSNGTSGHECKDALHKALRRYKDDKVKRKEALYRIMTRLVESALEGNLTAIGMIADRLDGKPTQAISGPTGEPLMLIERVIVRQVVDNSDVIDGEIDDDKKRDVIWRDNQQGDVPALPKDRSGATISNDN